MCVDDGNHTLLKTQVTVACSHIYWMNFTVSLNPKEPIRPQLSMSFPFLGRVVDQLVMFTVSATVDGQWFRGPVLVFNAPIDISLCRYMKVLHGTESTDASVWKMPNIFPIRAVDCVLWVKLEPSFAAWASTWSSIWNTAITKTFSGTPSSRCSSSQRTRVTSEKLGLVPLHLKHLEATQADDRETETVYLPFIFLNIGWVRASRCESFLGQILAHRPRVSPVILSSL